MKVRNSKTLSLVLGVYATLAMMPQVSFSGLELVKAKKAAKEESVETYAADENSEVEEQIVSKPVASVQQVPAYQAVAAAPAAAPQPQVIVLQLPGMMTPAPTGAVPAITHAHTNNERAVDDVNLAGVASAEDDTVSIKGRRATMEVKTDSAMQRLLELRRLESEEELAREIQERRAAKKAAAVAAQEAVVSDTVVISSNAAVAPVGAMTVTPAPTGATEVSVRKEDSSEERTQMSIFPRAGLSSMTSVSGYNIQSRYSAGLGVGVGTGENLSFELGYLFSEYGVGMVSTNPWVEQSKSFYGAGYNPSLDTVSMKQNVINAGLKIHLLGTEARLRPFIGGGAGYSKSFINYDASIINNLNRMGVQGMTNDYEVSSMLGYLTAGFDVKVAKNIHVGLVTQYYKVLTARENQNLNNAAFTGGYNPYSGYNAYGYNVYNADSDKQLLGGSLARASFYSILGNVTFTF